MNTPKIGVSACIFKDFMFNKVLLIKREKNPFMGKYAFPGGHI